MKEALTKKLGPLPRWVWAVALVAVLLYIRAKRREAAAAADQSQPAIDPYASYNTQDKLNAPVDSGPYGGTYPVGGGLGSGFDPTSFQEGIAFGHSNSTTTPSGSTLPPAAGGNPVVNITVNGKPTDTGSGGTGGKKGTDNKNRPTLPKVKGAMYADSGHRGQRPPPKHGYTIKGLGGGFWAYLPASPPPDRHSGTHTKKPKTGSYSGGARL